MKLQKQWCGKYAQLITAPMYADLCIFYGCFISLKLKINGQSFFTWFWASVMYVRIWWMVKFYLRIAFEPVRKFFPPNPKCMKMQNESVLLAHPCCKSTKYQSSALVLDSRDILIMFSNCSNSKVSSPCCMCLQLTQKKPSLLSTTS